MKVEQLFVETLIDIDQKLAGNPDGAQQAGDFERV